jgi:hypothetical protein
LLLVGLAAGCGLDLSKLDLSDLDPRSDEEPPDPVDIDDGKAKPKAVPGKGVVDLGVAVWPAGAASSGAVRYDFDVPPRHRLGFAFSKEEQQSVKDFYGALAKRLKYKKTGAKTFEWAPPKDCPPDLSCVYDALIKETRASLLPLARRFRARADAAKLDAVQLAQIMLAFVQQIPYELPDDAFGLKPPPLVVAERRGDCDSKSLLLHILYEHVGIDSVILSSQAHRHTLIGIALPVQGTTFRWKGRRYAFAETTAKGAPIGYLPKDVSSPNDWRVEHGDE